MWPLQGKIICCLSPPSQSVQRYRMDVTDATLALLKSLEAVAEGLHTVGLLITRLLPLYIYLSAQPFFSSS